MIHLAAALEDLKTAHQDPVWEYKRGGSWVTYDANSTTRLEEAARQGKAEKTVTLLAKAVPVDLSRMVHKTDEEELVRRTGLRAREKLNCLNQVCLSLCFTVFASVFFSFALFSRSDASVPSPSDLQTNESPAGAVCATDAAEVHLV
jgi:hypothetical protein